MNLKDLELLKKQGKIRGFESPETVATKKASKYGNRKTMVDNIPFDSVKEAQRYIQLRYLLNAGEITNLELQVPYELNDGGTHSLKYIADFVYVEHGETVIEDAKGYRTAVYKKKKKLMKSLHNIEIREV